MIFQLAEVVWSNVWAQTGMGFGVVFCVLVLLVFVLIAFSTIASTATKSSAKPKKVKAQPAAQVAAPVASASDADKAAIATALYLYFQNVHDEESDVITIRSSHNSAWHHELNNHFN